MQMISRFLLLLGCLSGIDAKGIADKASPPIITIDGIFSQDYYVGGQPVKTADVEFSLRSWKDPEIEQHFKDIDWHENVIAFSGMFWFTSLIAAIYLSETSYGAPLFATSLVCAGVGTVSVIISHGHFNAAIRKHNAHFIPKTISDSSESNSQNQYTFRLISFSF